MVAEAEVPVITSPLEFILDDVIEKAAHLAVQQNVNLYSVEVVAKRIGLIAGCVKLVSKKVFRQEPTFIPSVSERSAGVCDVPLNIAIDRDWLPEDVLIGEEKHTHETVLVSFTCNTERSSISDQDLRGLFNYSTAYDIIQSKQGYTLSSTIEYLLDDIASHIRHSVQEQGLRLLHGSVTITRTNYPRVTPSFVLQF